MPEIKLDISGSAAVIHYAGKISFKEKARLEEAVHSVLDANEVENIIVDMSRVDFIDSSGISLLLNTYQLTFRQKIGFYLYRPMEKITEILDALNLRAYFAVLDDAEFTAMTA